MIANRTLPSILLLGLLACTLPAGLAGAQSAEPPARADTLTAEEAVRRALAENPTIQAARQQRTAAAASIREARSEWFPVVQGRARYRRLSDNVDYTVNLPSRPGGGQRPVTFAPAILNRYSARVSVEQPVFTGFRIPNRLAAAQARTRSTRAEVRATKTDVAYRARAAYWRLYEARARSQAASDALRHMKRRLADVRNRRAAGRATEADVLRVEARRDRLRTERIRTQTAVESALRTLNDRMGRPLDAPVVLADTVTVDSVAREPAHLVDRAQNQRPALEALRQTLRARAAKVDAARASWFPQVSLTGSYLYARPNEQLFPPENRFQGTWDVGVQLSWRLSTGGRTSAAVDRARARRLRARYRLEDRRRAVAAEVKKQVQRVEEARQAVRAAETSLQSARAAYRAVQSRAEEGMAVVSDLLDAERALRAARADLAAAQTDYALAQAALDRALGTGVPEGEDGGP